MNLCLSPNGRAETRGESEAQQVFIGTLRGVYVLKRPSLADAWQCEQRGLADKHISSLLYDPMSNLLFAGIHGRGEAGGLFVSYDGGWNWEPRMGGLERTHVYTLALERRGTQPIMYAGVEPPAVYRSTNLGESWEDVGSLRDVPGTEKWTFPPPPHIAHVKNITLHPAQPGVIYVLIEQGAVLRSTDDGATWRELDAYSSDKDSFYRDVHRLVIGANDTQQLHLATGDGLYYSADGGETWEHQQRRTDRVGYPDALFLDPKNDATVFMGGAHDAPETWRTNGGAFPGFIVSNDRGRTWSERMGNLPQPIHGNIEAMAMHSSPVALEFFAGTAIGDIFYSSNAGEKWVCAATGLPPVSKGRHYRHFLSAEEKKNIEAEARAERRSAGLSDLPYQSNT